MSDLIWMNGKVRPMSEASIGVEDRGFQFADGVYEVIRIYNNKPFTLAEHMQRLERSCAGIGLNDAVQRRGLGLEITRFIQAGGLQDGMVYLQVTRGVAPRNHIFPAAATPTILFYTRPLPPVPAPGKGAGVELLTVPDERWKRCWIKAISLLANVLAKNVAIDSGADEAVFVEDGCVSECSASNLFAVIDGALVTHPVGPKVLPGITRLVLLDLAKQLGIPVIERPMKLEEAKLADELFITSTTRELNWVARWDSQTVAKACGPITMKLHEAYVEKVARETSASAPSPVYSRERAGVRVS